MVINYRQERFIKEKRQKIYGALFIILLVAFLGWKPVFSLVARVSHFIGIPIWKIEKGLKDNIEYISEIAKPKSVIVSELLNLRNDDKTHLEREAVINALKAENNDLKEAMGRKMDGKTVLSRVLSRPPLQVYDTFVIDVGSNQGITLLSSVYTRNDYVIGTVTRVFGNSSVVTMKSSPGETHQVMVPNFEDSLQDETNTSETKLLNSIVFIGIGGGSFKSQLPKHLSIALNTPMVLSSIDTEVIGVITGESVDGASSLKDVYGSLPFSMNSIDWVTVKIKENSSE